MATTPPGGIGVPVIADPTSRPDAEVQKPSATPTIAVMPTPNQDSEIASKPGEDSPTATTTTIRQVLPAAGQEPEPIRAKAGEGPGPAMPVAQIEREMERLELQREQLRIVRDQVIRVFHQVEESNRALFNLLHRLARIKDSSDPQA